MSWLGYSFLTLICFTFLNLLSRVVAVKSEEPRAGSFVFNLWGALVAVVLFLFTSNQKINIQPLYEPTVALLVLVSIIMYGGFSRLLFTVKKHIEASTSATLFRLSPVFTFIFSVLLLGESLSVQKVIGITLVLGGNILLVYNSKVLKLNKYFWLTVICTLLLGTAYTIDKVVSTKLDSNFYNLLLWVGPLPLIYLPFLSYKVIKREFILGSYKNVLMALFNVVGFYFQIIALSKGEASRVIPIISANSILIVILAAIFLKERNFIGKKIAAAGLATAGVLLLSGIL